MMKSRSGGATFAIGSVWACGFALLLSSACGSGDSSRKDRDEPEAVAGAGGQDDGSSAGDGPSAGGVPTSSGGSAASAGGASGAASAGEVAGGTDSGAAGKASEGGAAGATGGVCDSVEPPALQGVWKTDCNGYSCAMVVTASGDFGNGCTNGQYETGTLMDGNLVTLGEGGPFPAYSTKGTLTRTACDSVTRAYVGQIPPNTGPEQSYSCVMTRAPQCAPSLLLALAGVWDGACGSSTCETTITAQGAMTSTCSNGQQSVGAVEETGYFADVGSGGNFPDYSTTGVVGLTDCNSFVMPYTWQSPPNTGKKTSSKCTYTRQLED
ncbi:MAG: hypothetical protein K0R38_5058 [Polyangiaceae bacterium]|nr:hypothetical protein [Polyangiaceae bacterium]